MAHSFGDFSQWPAGSCSGVCAEATHHGREWVGGANVSPLNQEAMKREKRDLGPTILFKGMLLITLL
jgi:hypothetical protein